jgi:hypothetical protein
MNKIDLIIDALENSEPTGLGHIKTHWDKHQAALAAARELIVPVAKREWVGLTSEELATIVVEHAGYPTRQLIAIESKLKDKNT